MDEPSAELVKKELLQEWTHLEVESWRRMVRQQGKDPIEPEVSVRDRILWKVLSNKQLRETAVNLGNQSNNQDVNVIGDTDTEDSDSDSVDVKIEGRKTRGDGVVSFVFLRSATHSDPAASTAAASDI